MRGSRTTRLFAEVAADMPRRVTRPPATAPPGTLTFLCAESEGSALSRDGDAHEAGVDDRRLAELVQTIVERFHGHRLERDDDGGGASAAFRLASDALGAALALQLAALESLDTGGSALSVRIGLHSGEASPQLDVGYHGSAIRRCARVRSAAHGGQVLLSRSTYELVVDRLPEHVSLADLGAHRLKDLSRPEQIYQLCHPALPADFPRLLTLESRPNNLPAQLTSFIGREDDLEALRRLIAENRLVTLTGSGGCGKSRLAVQLAADLLERYPEGAWWVELASVGDGALVADAVARGIWIREIHGQELLTTIANHLKNREALLILDNCEHVIEACSAVVDQLARRCPALRTVATSREPLGITGEVTWRVRSLTVPERGPTQPVGALSTCESVTLFVERARASRPNFELSQSNANAVAEICRRLDGIPLAIELAAARARTLTPGQIASGLGDRFRMLTGGSRTLLARHRTLQASVEWSFSLLSDAERSVLQRLSVFTGGFSLPAAEAVGADEGIEPYGVLDHLARLVDRSLVLMDDSGSEARYRMLETIRQYAEDQLAQSGRAGAARNAHRDFYLAMLESAEAELMSHDQEIWLSRLDAEGDNIRAAMDWSSERDDAAELLRMCRPMALYWLFRGQTSEGISRLESALDATAAAAPLLRAWVMWGVSYVCVMVLDVRRILDWASRSLEIARHEGDRRLEGRSLLALSWPALFVDPTRDPRASFEESAAIAREIGDSLGLEESLQGLGLTHTFLGDPAAGRECFVECVGRSAASGNEWSSRQARCWLALAAVMLGEFDDARLMAREVIEQARAVGDLYFESMDLIILGMAETMMGAYDDARASLAQALDVSRTSGNLMGVAFAMQALARIENGSGNWEAARECEDEAHALFSAFDDTLGLGAVTLAESASASVDRGELGAAREKARSALDRARSLDDKRGMATALLAMARVARADDRLDAAEAHCHEALRLQQHTSDRPGMVDAVELMAEIASTRRAFEEAARLLAATDMERRAMGYARAPSRRGAHEAAVEQIREALGSEDFEATWESGARLTLAEAIAYASRGRGSRLRPPTGWASLTPAELQVVRLVSEGLSNPQVGARLFVSRETVKAHLSSIFGKLGVSSRTELTAEAVRRGL